MSQPSIDDEEERAHTPSELRSSGSPGTRQGDKITPARDITSKFQDAARALSALSSGELVHDASYTLLDSLPALEIMDPKMDGGITVNGKFSEAHYDVLRELSPEEVIGIMDQLLCFEMAWHMGHSLHQTLFTSFYIERLIYPEPDTLEEAQFDRSGRKHSGNDLLHIVLRAYCLALIKTCDHAYRRITAQKYYPDEDFVPELWQRSLLSKHHHVAVAEILGQAMHHVEGFDPDDLGSSLTLRTKAGYINSTTSAILDRLDLRARLLLATVYEEEEEPFEIQGNFGLARILIQNISESRNLGVTVPDAYSIKLQRDMAGTVPPKPVVELPFTEAVKQVEKWTEGSIAAYNVIKVKGCSNILNFLSLFQTTWQACPVYVRSLLQASTWYSVEKEQNDVDVIYNDLAEIILPTSKFLNRKNEDIEVPHDPRFEIAETMRAFVERVLEPYRNMYINICMNRSRFRRELCNALSVWEAVEHDVETFDQKLRHHETSLYHGDIKIMPTPFESWASMHKNRQMQSIIQVGFELDLYQDHEMSCMYWYLSYLSYTMITQMKAVSLWTRRKLDQAINKRASSGKIQKLRDSLDGSLLRMNEQDALKSFADCLSSFYSFLAHAKIIPKPYSTSPYSEPRLMYDERMKAFLSLDDPPIPSYEQILPLLSLQSTKETGPKVSEVMNANPKKQELGILQVAQSAIEEAKAAWTGIRRRGPDTRRFEHCEAMWQKDITSVIASIINTSIELGKAQKALEISKGRPLAEVMEVEIPPSGSCRHSSWIVPVVKVKEFDDDGGRVA